MRLLILTSCVMLAFAANSVLNRAALLDGQIDPLSFAWIRTVSGAVALLVLVAARDGWPRLGGPLRPLGSVSLAVYMTCFSLAYVAIDTGVGALILFGGAQVTLFAGALILREAVPAARWAGAALALAGLVWLVWPGAEVALSLGHAGLMLAAAIAWGIYSLVGQRAGPPLTASAANFTFAAPICIAVALLTPLPPGAPAATSFGITLALVSGIGTSALAYALWYAVLPRLDATLAGLAMITVPVLAAAGGLLILGEAMTLRFALASALVLGGVAIGVLGPQWTKSSKGS